MFQVAHAVALRKRFSCELKFVDLTRGVRFARHWELDGFGLSPTPMPEFSRRALVALWRSGWAIQKRLGVYCGIAEEVAAFNERSWRPVVVGGYWQSDRFFRGAEVEVRTALKLPDMAIERDRRTPLVGVQVRRGDYASDPRARSRHLVCTTEWYQRALDRMREAVGPFRTAVFSDDIAWTKENLGLSGEVQYIEGTGRSDIDMALLASCDHHVISNSSFGWWGAYLGGRDGGNTVIAPREWFVGDFISSRTVCPGGWILF